MKDAKTLDAAYVLNSGKLKLSNADATSENKVGKLMINDWLETDDFLFIGASVDQDFPINRQENKVMFRYYYYNKKDGKLYLKEGRKIYPEEYTLDCSIEGALPLLANTAKVYQKKLYTRYTKSQLKRMIDSPNFKKYSDVQQEKLKSLHGELSDDGLLVMVLE